MHRLIVSTAALALFSCGIDVRDKERGNPAPETRGKPGRLPDFRAQSPGSPGPVRPGDRILIRLAGKVLRPRVGDEYVKRIPSRWREEDCRETGRQDDQGYPEEKCVEVPVTGTCEIKYRDFHGMDESPLTFPPDVEPPGIKIAIGQNTYRPKKIIRRTPAEMILAFTVAPEMIPDGGAAEAAVLPPAPGNDPVETVKYGFMGFGECPGRTDRDAYGFTHAGHEIQSEHPAEKIEYTIDAIIEPDRHNTKTTNPEGGTNHV